MYSRSAAILASLAAASMLLTGCAAGPAKNSAPAAAALAYPDNLHWFRDSAEQKAIYTETYRAATQSARRLSEGLAARSWGVILDVDETILDNSQYQKRQALKGAPFETASWNAWIDERAATLLPGARDFIDAVEDDLHGQVVLITNRAASQCAATEENLRRVGIRYDRILCDSVGDGDKNGRFRAVIRGESGAAPALNVLIWVGDNIQDFPSLSQAAPGDFSPFGTRYFSLPNPVYGSWQKVPVR